ncbi:epimerase [Shewanella sp. c952]|uniref:NAD-dependent epimerase/dehydratase family protein n=1 Tax=Shewanella sp. c952 TaxID=2815913 RepID=UPI001BC79690|nr:NAD-dependent epimerase/dehydratase family protein [Shewanella sp. c952]GIU20007.1 epimerase [Shewanella sp. c952]
MSTLLTGATGFIGSFIARNNNDFNCVVRKNERRSFNLSFGIDKLDGNTNWEGAFSHIDSVIHLAGLAHSRSCINKDYQSVNVDGTLHLANEAAKGGVKRFVFVSSIGVNGTSSSDVPFSILSTVNPNNDYAQSKYDAEIGLKKISTETGMELVIIRPTLVYGPNAPGNFGSLARLVFRFPFLPFALVNNRRDFISVQNLADLLVTCAKHPKAGGHTFLASDSETVSISEFTQAIAKGFRTNLFQLPVPIGLMCLAGKLLGKSIMIEQLVGNLEVDSSNLKEILDWIPPYTMEQSMAFLKPEK